jgi:hypothetical protein
MLRQSECRMEFTPIMPSVVDHLSDQAFESMAADCNELIALLVSSIKTIKNNNK